MNKLSVVYATKTGHSKKLAESIGKALNLKAENISDHPVLEEADILFITGGIYGGQSLPELLEFVKKIEAEEIKKVALITSCASKKQGQDGVRELLQEKNIKVVDEILCQGSFLLMKMGHPNKEDIQEAVDFAVRLSEKAGE